MSSKDRHVSLVTTILGVLAALLLVTTVGTFLQGWALRRVAAEERKKVVERPYPELEAYHQEQEQALSANYFWIDQAAGTVHLPIERAMALVVAEAGAPVADGAGEGGR
ncbi:MAG: hypothetical protein KDD11_02565 [Acidobacteria bacterium]|nr:hypothetical protein [Acidobacteriota bacterium]